MKNKNKNNQNIVCPCCYKKCTKKYLQLFSKKKLSSSWGVTTGNRVIYHCLSCDARFADSVFDSDKNDRHMYNHEYHNSMSGESSKDEERSGLIEQSLERIKLIKRFKSSGFLLDIGSSTGLFLQYAKKKFDISGIDPSSFACKKARKRLGKNATIEESGILQSEIISSESFDIVTLWDVIEHCRDVDRAMVKIIASIRPNGIIVVRTPDIASIFFQIALKAYHLSFRKINYPVLSIFHADHHYFFSKKSLINLFQKHNLQVVSIHSDPLLWKRFKYCECHRGFFINFALSFFYWSGRFFGKGHGIVITGKKRIKITNRKFGHPS